MRRDYDTFIVTGGRQFSRQYIVNDVLSLAIGTVTAETATLLVGDCPTGADAHARAWARENGVELIVFTAEWDKFGRRAGPMRNQRMIHHGADMLIAFYGHESGGKNIGTRDCVKRAQAAGMAIMRVWEDNYARHIPPKVFQCPLCGSKSYHPKDREHGYCGRCHAFTGTPAAEEITL